MHQAVEEIIDRLIGAVTSDKPFYTLKDCLAAGFPNFIVERIRIEVNETVKDEFTLQESKWVNTEERLVEDAWKDFQQVLFAHSRIPKSKFYVVTSRVMSDIVKVYLEPRKYMADYIYKKEDELLYDELVERTNKLTIYKHFGRAIPLYMKKRKLKSLKKKRCKLLIHNLDANLVTSYTAQDWAKALELLFTLFGGKIDAKLIQLFFEDKGLYLTAKAFNELDEKITKERFIEILSYPDLLDVKLQEKFREQFREELSAQKNRSAHPDKEETEEIDEKEQRLLDSFFGDYSQESAQMTDEESFNALFKTEQYDKSIFEEFEEVPDAEKISESLKEGEQSDEILKFRKNLITVLDQAADSFKNLSGEEQEQEEKHGKEDSPQKPDIESEPEAALPEMEETEEIEQEEDILDLPDAAEAEDKPSLAEEAEEQAEEPQMWQQFLNADQMEVLMGSADSEDELIDEEALIDESEGESEEHPETPSLQSYLERKESMFVLELFDNNRPKYEEILDNIQELSGWEKAANYIEKYIFTENEVDMSSEVTIAFIDDLQSYFEAHKS